jgi:hypothetical protein
MAIAACVLASPAFAQEFDQVFADSLLEQLSCKADPDPTAVLLYLNKTKRITLDGGDKSDSETCWPIRPQLRLAKMNFTHICASAEEPLLLYLFPRLYWRGPGTSAGTGLRLITEASIEVLKPWAASALGNGPYQIDEAVSQSGKSEISCNKLWRD